MEIASCGVVNGRCITIMSNGDVMHCRRLPVVMGSVLKDKLANIWNYKEMKNLRDLDKCHSFCKDCSNFSNCFGGARCINYAYKGETNIPDIQCWRAYKDIDEPVF